MGSDRSSHRSRRHERTGERKFLVFLVLWIAIQLVLILRDPGAGLDPALSCEDGSRWFVLGYGGDPAWITTLYAGYLSLLPQVLGFLIGRLPTPWMPFALFWVGMVLATLTFTVFHADRFATLVRPRLGRFLLSLGFAAWPVGNWALVGTTYSSFWNLTLMLVVLSFVGLSRRRVVWVVQLVWMLLLVWSGPLSVVLLPYYAVRAVRPRERGDRAAYGVLAVAAAAYLALATRPAAVLGPGLLTLLPETLRALLGHVVFEGFAGPRAWQSLADHGLSAVPTIAGGTIVLVLAWLIRRCWTRFLEGPRKLVVYAVFLMSAWTLLCLHARGTDIAACPGTRYWYIQKFLLALVVVTTVAAFARSWTVPARRVAVAAVAVWLIGLNLANRANYVHPRDHRALAFVAELWHNEILAGTRRGQYARLERGDWPIVVDTR